MKNIKEIEDKNDKSIYYLLDYIYNSIKLW